MSRQYSIKETNKMDIKKVLSKSTRTDSNNINGTQFFTLNDDTGFLGVPLDNHADIAYRDILCNNQGQCHIPYMKFVADSDDFRWYETEVLEQSTFETVNEIMVLNGEGVDNLSRFIDDIDSSYYDTLELLVGQIPDEFIEDTYFDLHIDNIRINFHDEIFFCDIFIYRGDTK